MQDVVQMSLPNTATVAVAFCYRSGTMHGTSSAVVRQGFRVRPRNDPIGVTLTMHRDCSLCSEARARNQITF